ncbi:MAG: 16S rRNA (uracil1498-N3)-methyltransferase [Roseivirga sp.]|jgi:16S rRNA (uracil1498-N3)-methyltransferase
MQLFYQPLIPEGTHHLDEEESRHAIKVLRLTAGSEIQLTDGKGSFYSATIKSNHHKKCEFEITSQSKQEAKSTFRHIAIAPTKNLDRIEWFLEKAVEFGIDKVTFLVCDHSERKILKLDRLEKKAISAMKQSGQAFLPHLSELTPFKTFIKQIHITNRFIAYVDFGNEVHLKDSFSKEGGNLVLIGPEGDFSENEVKLALAGGFQKVSLGANRLRTETAGIAAVHLINLM